LWCSPMVILSQAIPRIVGIGMTIHKETAASLFMPCSNMALKPRTTLMTDRTIEIFKKSRGENQSDTGS
jgi:hypothetical protein